MDVSQNLIDLKYLTNPAFLDMLDQKEEVNILNNSELHLYKKRIFLLSKDFLQGKKTNDKNLNKIFEHFIKQCISYFKFNDKKDIIQNDYKDFKHKKKGTVEIFHENPNNFIMRKSQPKIPKITDHIDIKTTKTEKKIVIPKIRNIGLKKKKKKKKDKDGKKK